MTLSVIVSKGYPCLASAAGDVASSLHVCCSVLLICRAAVPCLAVCCANISLYSRASLPLTLSLLCRRSRCAVVASEKGVVVGRLTFTEDGDHIDCRRMGVGGKAIPPNISKVRQRPQSKHARPRLMHLCSKRMQM
jgi:hypothetical protein